jgi:tetratricopeptide (TPR) repeat protein
METLDFITWLTVIGGLAGIGAIAMIWAYQGSGSISVLFDEPVTIAAGSTDQPDQAQGDHLIAFRRGIDCFRDQNYRDAYIDFTQALQAMPNLAEAYHNRGLAAANLRQDGEAARDLARAGELYLEQNNQAGFAAIKEHFEVLKARKQ